jgi:hypothetical protein
MNPFYKEQKRLQEALNLDRPKSSKVRFEGEKGAGGVTTYGAIVGINNDNDTVEIAAYGGLFVLHNKWVTDNEDGTVRILHKAFRKCKELASAKRRFNR